jgi:hypothetical protein
VCFKVQGFNLLTIIIYMEAERLGSHMMNSLAQSMVNDWNNTSRQSINISEEIQSKPSRLISSDMRIQDLGIGLIAHLFDTTDHAAEREFIKMFLFGVPMQIYRKGRVKNATVFLDPYIPTLMWISSKTKAFLIDLGYVTLSLSDLSFEAASGC